MDYRSMDSEALRKAARERKVASSGAIGATSWLAVAKRDAIIAALEANDCGVILDATGEAATGSTTTADSNVKDALAKLADALSRPAGLDEARVRDIARSVITESGSVRVDVHHASGAVVKMTGQHKAFQNALALASAGIPLILFGPKGSGKSTGAASVAEAMGLEFVADSFSMDSARHDVFGFVDGSGNYVSAAFYRAYRDGLLYIADEQDNGTANLTAAFNLALSNGHCQFPNGERVARHERFRFIATCNELHGPSLLHPGREPLDGAFLDRCAVVAWDIDTAHERRVALANGEAAARDAGREHDVDASNAWVDMVHAVRAIADEAGLARLSPSPRASIYGCQMLARGMAKAACVETLIYRGADADTRSRLAAGVR